MKIKKSEYRQDGYIISHEGFFIGFDQVSLSDYGSLELFSYDKFVCLLNHTQVNSALALMDNLNIKVIDNRKVAQ